jgi:tRNA G18 (ribose-2'-O)-methylase SpoU
MALLRVQPVAALDLPELAPYRSMRAQRDLSTPEVFVAEGDKIVQRLLDSTLTVESLLLPEPWVETLRPAIERRPERELPVFVAAKATLENLIGFSMYQGVLAVGRVPAATGFELLETLAPRPALLAAVDGLSNAENLGVLVRNAAGFGVQALLVGETSSSPYLRRAVRSSMGAVFNLPRIEPPNLSQALRALRQRGFRCLAAHPHADHVRLSQVDFRQDICVVFGSEGEGLSPQVLSACDLAAAIPMQHGVDSLNVGSASAAFLYEAARQRQRA